MALKISGTRFDGKTFEFEASKLDDAKTEWITYAETINVDKTLIPSYIDLVYSGDLMLVYPRWTFNYKDDSLIPAAVGVTYNGVDVTFKYKVTSTTYTYTVFNDTYVCILSKTDYTPVVKNYKGFYLTKVFYDPDKSTAGDYGAVNDFDDLMQSYYSDVDVGEPKSKFEFVKLSYIYDNNLYTFATICNALAKISGKFTFSITGTVLKIYFGVSYMAALKHIGFMPLICSFDINNTFNEEYFSEDLTYYCTTISNKFDSYDCIEQTIDMTKTAGDSVKLVGIHSRIWEDQYYDIVFNKVDDPADVSTTFDEFVSDSFTEPEPTTVLGKILKNEYVKKVLEFITPYLDEYAPFVYNIDSGVWFIIICATIVIIVVLIISSLTKKNNDNPYLQMMMLQQASLRRRPPPQPYPMMYY